MTRLEALARFIWDFVVGDDWRIAAGVVVALAVTAVIAGTSVSAWWILPVAVGVFLGVSRGSRGRLADPWLVAGLMLAAAAVDAVGEHLVLSGDNGPIALWLADGIPQIMCLLIIGRLAAELIRPGLDQAIAPARAGPASGAGGAGPGARSGSS